MKKSETFKQWFKRVSNKQYKDSVKLMRNGFGLEEALILSSKNVQKEIDKRKIAVKSPTEGA